MAMTRTDINRIKLGIQESIVNDLQLLEEQVEKLTIKVSDLEYAVEILIGGNNK